MFKCDNCDKVLSTKARLDYHLLNKVCHKPNKSCPSCGKTFRSKQNCQYHISQLVCKKKVSLKLKTIDPSNDHNSHLSKDELLIKVAKLEGQVEALTDHPQTINNSNNNSNSNNNIIIFPNAFGKEDIALIQQKLGDILGPLIKHQTFDSIPNLFNTIHNNTQMPEYHNVYATCERSSYAMVSDGQSFKYRPKKTIIDQIIEDKRTILNDYVDQYGDQLGEKILSRYEKYKDKIDDDTEFRKNLELEIGGLLLDMKSVIANDERTRKLLDKVTEGRFDLQPND